MQVRSISKSKNTFASKDHPVAVLASSRLNAVFTLDLNIVDLTPLLLARRIPKLIRAPVRPDMLSHLLPRHLGRLLTPQSPVRHRMGGSLGVDRDRVAKEFNLANRSARLVTTLTWTRKLGKLNGNVSVEARKITHVTI